MFNEYYCLSLGKVYMSELIYIEGSDFLMGSNNNEKDEFPAHLVTVNSFYLSKYVVTQKEWNNVIKISHPYNKGYNYPIEQITWDDAINYCNKLSILDKLDPVYRVQDREIVMDITGNGYRLPTEAEWEFAAKGGIKSKGYLYSGSNNPLDIGWFKDNSDQHTHEVGQLQSNELGLYDMSGNIYEFCWDVFKEYTNNYQNNPIGRNICKDVERHSLRGGNCHGLRNRLRCTSRRNGLYKGFVQDFIGFRVAKNA